MSEEATNTAVATEDDVREALKVVIDPEIGINIVDLGLVYDITVDEGQVNVTFTLTTMGCPIGPMIEQQMQQVLSTLPGVEAINPQMVFRPAWTPEMMSEEAKAALGYL
ncbi:MAG: metal-sulfur cluster assembly factor [Actinomycetota bacterium]|nr:metal-sulfur cluster assembly factor [Actinomycetota bacterium]